MSDKVHYIEKTIEMHISEVIMANDFADFHEMLAERAGVDSVNGMSFRVKGLSSTPNTLLIEVSGFKSLDKEPA